MIKEIEKIRRKLFWQGLSDDKKMISVSWYVICKPKRAGGLGILDLALLGKWAWSLLMKKTQFGPGL